MTEDGFSKMDGKDNSDPAISAINPITRVDEQTARALAKDIVQKMLGPISSGLPVAKYGPLKIIDLIYVGAYFTRSLVQFGFDPLDDETYSIFETFPPDPNRVEELLFRRIVAGKENPNEIIEATQKISRLTKFLGSYRRVFISLFKDAVPGGIPGRRKKVDEYDLPRLAALSDHLVPASKDFLMLSKHFPQRSAQESLDFLAAGFPEQVKYLAQHREAFERLLQDKKFLRTAKTDKSRLRLIADAMAGCEFGLKPSYAVRKAKEARRRSKAGANVRKAQN
jgi:hypothetical protein